MPPKKQQQQQQQKGKQPLKGGKTPLKPKSGGAGKPKKKKWSKGKVRDKLDNSAMFDAATYDKMCKEVPNYKLITPAVVSERLKIRASLARRALVELLNKGLIREVVKHHTLVIYTRAPKGDEPQ